MPKLIAGNWKMHGLNFEAEALARAIKAGAAGVSPERATLLVCPPFTALATVGAALLGSPILLGAQDCHPKPEGAYTGDISAPMLHDLGVRFVILGHSERRSTHDESDALVQAKVVAAHAAGLIPIVCVGETLAERDAGRADDVIGSQLAASLPADLAAAGGVIAYEPIWAIGSGRTPTAKQVSAMHTVIRSDLVRRFRGAGRDLPILYGGSVKPDNARAILALPEVGGALIGGASLKAEDFLTIAKAA
ncbi:MAG: triose-phosphate isomerase [Acetobacteraceae bacterium]